MTVSKRQLGSLLKSIRACTECSAYLPLGPRPIVAAGRNARIAIIGQAPGKRVHETGVPWDDASGERLRDWLGVTRDIFYDSESIALVPMGFCYPGKGKSGDLPPRPECQPLWHDRLLAQLVNIELTLVIGQYAQAHYLGEHKERTLTETVKAWKKYGPDMMPLPHPSPRNNIWLKKNPWFGKQLLPVLQKTVGKLLARG